MQVEVVDKIIEWVNNTDFSCFYSDRHIPIINQNLSSYKIEPTFYFQIKSTTYKALQKQIKCECGAASIGVEAHSSWCPRHS